MRNTMTEISASAVKELRERTGAGMMDCKNALKESQGDMDESIAWLRKKGLSQAAKKSSRAAVEGLIGVHVDGNKAAIIEVNAETDFVARNEHFQNYVYKAAQHALDCEVNVDTLKNKKFPQSERSFGEELTHMIALIGENMNTRRLKSLHISSGTISSYIHNALADNLGRVGVLVALEGAADKTEMEKLGRSIAMHIAAAHPQALDVQSLDPAIIDQEKKIHRDKAVQSGKPAEIIEKMVEGSIRKFYEESVLLEQIFMIDDTKRKVSAVIADKARDLKADIKLVDYVHYKLGDGLEKKDNDFAHEVAELTKSY